MRPTLQSYYKVFNLICQGIEVTVFQSLNQSLPCQGPPHPCNPLLQDPNHNSLWFSKTLFLNTVHLTASHVVEKKCTEYLEVRPNLSMDFEMI